MAMTDFQIENIKIDAEVAQKKLDIESEFLLDKLNMILKKISNDNEDYKKYKIFSK